MILVDVIHRLGMILVDVIHRLGMILVDVIHRLGMILVDVIHQLGMILYMWYTDLAWYSTCDTPTWHDTSRRDTPTWHDTSRRDTPTWHDTLHVIHRLGMILYMWYTDLAWYFTCDTPTWHDTSRRDTPTWHDTSRRNTPTWHDTLHVIHRLGMILVDVIHWLGMILVDVIHRLGMILVDVIHRLDMILYMWYTDLAWYSTCDTPTWHDTLHVENWVWQSSSRKLEFNLAEEIYRTYRSIHSQRYAIFQPILYLWITERALLSALSLPQCQLITIDLSHSILDHFYMQCPGLITMRSSLDCPHWHKELLPWSSTGGRELIGFS